MDPSNHNKQLITLIVIILSNFLLFRILVLPDNINCDNINRDHIKQIFRNLVLPNNINCDYINRDHIKQLSNF
jgi:hypothetical protein